MKLSPKIVVSGVIGNALENYDYILYANFAIIIGNTFFPVGDPYVSLILTFGIFAAGFITRPLGAIVFGHIGDKYSRKKALSISIMLMSFPTSLIGLIPSYSEVGILAPIFLVVIRMMQGISIGGETSGFMTYLMESIPNQKHKYLFGGIALSSTALGIFLGFAAVFICNFYFSDVGYAWRIPFLISFPVGIVGFYIRSKLEETHDFKDLKDRNLLSKSPFLELIKNHKISFCIISGLFVSISIPFYIFFGFLATFMIKIMNYSQVEVSLIYLFCSFIFIFTPFISGVLSDKFGVYKVLLSTIVIFVIFILPIFHLIFSENFLMTFLGAVSFIFLISLYQGSVPSLVTQIFSARVRSIGTALSFNVISVICGGLAPLLLTRLIQIFGNHYVIVFYMMVSSLVTIITLLTSRRFLE